MTNYSATIGTTASIDTESRPATKGFWRRLFDRMVAARQAQADRQIQIYINGLSDQARKDLGFPVTTSNR
jgi:hypothetical protein